MLRPNYQTFNPSHQMFRHNHQMLRRVLPALFLVLLISTGFKCNKGIDYPVLTGKLIASDGCVQFVVEVVDGPVDPALVVPTWKNTDNDSVYYNVFRLTGVRNACAIGFYGVSKGDTFQFQFDPHPQQMTCNTCAVMTTLAMPPISNSIMNVKKM
jgi:hypothetical protein